MEAPTSISPFTRENIVELRGKLRPYIRSTPVFERDDLPGAENIRVNFKGELFQVGGTFKTRGAFANIFRLTAAARSVGVTCVSAGNHAVAVAYAAMKLATPAKVVMPRSANPVRIALCKTYGAEVVLVRDTTEAFDTVKRIEQDEGRYFVHPFSGIATVLGTATLGQEWVEQAGVLDALIIPVGGGGLLAGISTAFRMDLPECAIFGVEPEGADVMHRSLAAREPIKMGAMNSIADSLMAPHTERFSLDICRNNVTRMVKVSDDEIRQSMRLLFNEMKLAIEPACAAATAALLGPLRNELTGKRVGVLLCGTNTDPATLNKHLSHP